LTATLPPGPDVAKDGNPGFSAMTRHVCLLVHPGFVPIDLAGPLEAFSL